MLCFLLLSFVLIPQVYSVGYYKVLGSSLIRPNSEYHAAVSTHGTSVPTSVTVGVVGRQENGRIFNVEQSLVVEPYTTRVARLEIGDIGPGDYTLMARGNGGVSFETSSMLNYTKKSYSVFIQTDKAVYDPGSKILFRAIILNSQLKPALEIRNEPLTVQITDGENNVVKKWENVIAVRGVFPGELILSKSPVLGDWHISVSVHGQTFNKTVQVVSYVLPKFLVDIQMKKHVTFSENTIVATIQSQYNYGQKLKGVATVTMYPTITSGVIQPIFQNPVRKVVPIDGSVTVEFDIKKEVRLNDEYERNVIVDVIVEEALTERKQNNSMEVFVHKYAYKMDLIKTADYYKPGLKYTAYIKVSNHDGSPIADDKRKVIVRHGYSKANEIYQEEIYKLNKNGIVELSFYPSTEATNETALRIEAEYLDLKEWFSPTPASVSSSQNYILATLITEKPTLNKDIEVLVNCTEPLSYITYELFGRGDLLLGSTVPIRSENTYRLHFTATQAMTPIAHLIVSYIRSDGELVADSLDIEFHGLLRNSIEIQTNSAEVSPNSDVDITIKSQPNSYIGLLAIDQNMVNLKSGHDIVHDMVAKEMTSYDLAESSPYFRIFTDQKKHFPWKPGSSNARNLLQKSGALILTNSFVNSRTPTLEDVYLRPPQYGGSTVKPDRGPALYFQSATRPPLAGPYAFSRIPKSAWVKPRIYLSNEIQDTWLFTNFSSGFEGRTSIRRKVPESLTTWVITGFSLDPVLGLGLTESPRKLKVSSSFSLNLDLPYSVQRGETLAVPVIVYNDKDEDIEAEVTLHNSEQKFEFTSITNDNNNPNETVKIELYRRKSVSVKAHSGSRASFMIKPTQLGYMEIKVTANSKNSANSVEKNILVKAEGDPQYYSKGLLIDLRKTSSFKNNITLLIPKNIVAGSLDIEVSVVGDLLGPTIMNLDNLILKPTGCGEQNLLHLMSNIIIMDYLMKTENLAPTIKSQCIVKMESAYQQQLTYKRKDGSFSLFGSMDTNGSIWLTALVAQSFKQARSYIFVENNIIKNALQWLSDNQAPNGSFPEIGSIVHQKVQSLDGNQLALTSFVALAFLENQELSPEYANIVQRSLDYVSRNLDEDEDLYTIALSTYALALAKHPSQQVAMNILELKAQNKNSMKFWAEEIPKNEEKNPWQYLPKSLDIETTSYALAAYVERGLIEDAIPVVNWLVGQENPFGGFASSRDTIVALNALSKLAGKLTAFPDMRVKFSYKKQESSSININKDNAMIVQKYKVGSDARQINITAEGSGLALLKVTYQFNVNVTAPWPMFTLDPQVDKNSNRHHVQLSICSGFVSRNLTEYSESNMAIMEVNLPSGFTADLDALPSLGLSQNIKLVETKNKDTTVVLYFDKFKQEEYCPTVSAFRTYSVARQKPVSVIIYDYYDTSRKARVFYLGPSGSLCDICDKEDCQNVCTLDPKTQTALEGENSHASTSSLNVILIYLTTLYFIGLYF